MAVIGDPFKEPTESFSILLSGSEGATLADSAGVVTITDSDLCTHIIGPGDLVLNGTAGDDVLCGDSRDNRINGLGGNDIVYGRNGADVIDSGPGTDTLNGEGGEDHLRGDLGADTLNGGGGNDPILEGLDGNDIIDGGSACRPRLVQESTAAGVHDQPGDGRGLGRRRRRHPQRTSRTCTAHRNATSSRVRVSPTSSVATGATTTSSAPPGSDHLTGGAGNDKVNGGPGTATMRSTVAPAPTTA